MIGDPFGLAGRVAVVTGGGSGIGRGIARALAACGARVAILDRGVAGGEAVRSEIAASGGIALFAACDTSDAGSVAQTAAQTAAAFGPCDVLVNNAGMIRSGSLDTLPLAQWNALLAVNLTGYFICAQAFGAQMRASGKGALVHISSIAATHATPGAGAYSVAKAGVSMLSRQLAIEWGPDGIRSNVVNPGLIRTPLSEATYRNETLLAARSRAVPAGRIGGPDDVAEAVLFLASDRAAYISGDEITVDGGFGRTLMRFVPREA